MKLKLMIIVSIVTIAIVGCSTSTGVFENSRYSQNYKEAFIDGFKTLTFCRCLENSTDRDLKLYEEDVSCRIPDYLYAESKTIDSLARQEAHNIQHLEAERTTQRAEGMEGKIITSTCLAFYNSKKLDVIARQRFIANEKSMKNMMKE